MAKKKERIIYNIDEVRLEIDYNKLAEAMAKVNEKQCTQYSVSSEWMKFLITPVFWGVAVITGLLAIAFVVRGGMEFTTQINNMPYNTDWWQVLAGLILIVIGLFLTSLCAFTAATAKEIDKEKDRGYVATMFSNVVALVALVISLIALVSVPSFWHRNKPVFPCCPCQKNVVSRNLCTFVLCRKVLFAQIAGII